VTFRVGIGYDNHRLKPGRGLILGGVEIPAAVEADAHSDGDVLVHALVDALLGAIGAGDIGTHFPDSDPRWKGQSSRLFLEHAARMVAEKGYRVANLDTVVILEKERIGAHRSRIVQSLRAILAPWFALEEGAIGVKAKTNEGCDSLGEGKALAAHAVVLLVPREAP
jgi:2-C-methyl-D-erythritol 2,4-cyclodiphosphate synthase